MQYKDEDKQRFGTIPSAQDSLLVDLHCHSVHSDGALSPELVAYSLFKAGVKYASLTDHDSIAGLDAFHHALSNYGIGYVTGVEITTQYKEQIIHLLGYGFDAQDKALNAALTDARRLHNPSVVGVATSHVSTENTISMIHRAGGITIMAHPLKTESNIVVLQHIIDELVDAGLDGIEAIYLPNTDAETSMLTDWIAARQIVTSAGTDSHAADASFGISMSIDLWKKYRDSLLVSSHLLKNDSQSTKIVNPQAKPGRNYFAIMRIIFPAVIALLLFIVALFGVLTPFFEKTLFERKRETVREVTKVALQVLDAAADEAANNLISLEDAQEQAKIRIEAMRFGRDGEEYFWIQDLTPRILMHPYRTDLVNQDVSEFKDARDVRIFVEFVNVALEKQEGFVSYVWQWNDDPTRLEAKESYVRLFEKWNWIIGSGIYDKEVKEDIVKLEEQFLLISIIIDLIIVMIIILLAINGTKSDKARQKAEQLLNESADRYRALTEAASEGVLVLYENRCSYANAVMYEFLGCKELELQLLNVEDVFPNIPENTLCRDIIHHSNIKQFNTWVQGILVRYGGKQMRCELKIKNKSSVEDRNMIMLVRRLRDETSSVRKLNPANLYHSPASLAADITNEISRAIKVEDIVHICRSTQELVHLLLINANSATEVSYILSSIMDATTQKLIDIAIQEIGPPPSDYVFLGLGSHGREAQTLYSDQDNAIIYYPSSRLNEPDTQAYFLMLAEKVCLGLEIAGYRKCTGKMMANNPEWCQSISVWKKYFKKWVFYQDSKDIMEFSVFFDFRAVAGNSEIAQELRDFLSIVLVDTPQFLVQLAKSALMFSTPVRLFGNILTDGGKDHPGQLDVKAPNLSIVSFARLYSLKEGIQETNTVCRLDAITRSGVLLDSTRRNILTAFEALFRMRLWNQVQLIDKNYELSNWITINQIGHIDEVILKECFKEIELLQDRIRRDFFGGNQIV